MNLKKKTVRLGLILLLPAMILLLLFCAVPFFSNIYLSFLKWDGYNQAEFVGLKNYISVFANSLSFRAFKNSLLYAFTSTLSAVVLGLLMATLIIRLSEREGGIFRVILYSPAMLPTAVVGVMFVFFFNPEMGLLNSFFRLIGLESFRHVWLQDKTTAMACLIFVAIWKCSGSVMMIVFAAMQNIPRSLYESSYLEGASYHQQVMKITLPLIKPTIALAAISTLGGQFKSYDLIFSMTQGGPADLTTTVPIVMKKYAFSFGSFGTAAAMGVLFTIVVAVSLIALRWSLRGETYEY